MRLTDIDFIVVRRSLRLLTWGMRSVRNRWFGLCAGLLLTTASLEAFLNNSSLRQEFETAISRRVSADSAGRIYLLTIDRLSDGPPSIRVRVGPSTARSLEDFSEFAHPAHATGFDQRVISAGLVVDGKDRLHVAWTNEEGRTAYTMLNLAVAKNPAARNWVNPVTGEFGALILAPDSSRIGDLVLGPDGEPWLVWSVSRPSHDTSHYLGAWIVGHWQTRLAAKAYGLASPSLRVDRPGEYQLAWHDIYETSWMLTGKYADLDGSALPAPRSLPGSGYRPVFTESGSTLVAVRESNHHELQAFHFADKSEVITTLNRDENDRRFAWDTLHSPQLIVDGHGVTWMFFIDSARRTVFHTRWLGTGWGPIGTAGSLVRNSSRMEDSHLVIDRIAVNLRRTAGRDEISLLMENTSDTPTAVFRRIGVLSPEATPGRKLLFFDLEEFAEIDGASLRLNSPTKQGTIIPPGEPGDFDDSRTGPFLRVLKENGRYRMWYAGYKNPPESAGWWEGYRVGYAESTDGRRFHPVNLGLASFNSKKDTNIIPGLPYVPQGMLYDELEPQAERRYKLLKFPSAGGHNDEARAGRMDPWTSRINGQLLVSADGVHWNSEPASMDFPGGRPQELIPQSLFCDTREPDLAKRYKAYGYSSLNLHRRVGSVAYSPDGRHWTAWKDNPVLDPFAGGELPLRGGIVDQIHDTVVWRENDYYLALYQYQHDKVYLDLRLAVSRDGEHFTFVCPGEVFLAAGSSGAWDAEQLNPSVPLVDDEEIKVYYGAVQEGAGAASVGPRTSSLGLATLRLDGFTDLRIEAGRKSAAITTVPIRPTGAERILINADCGRGRIVAELIDASTNRVLPGYSAADCIPLEGDSLAHTLSWKGAPNLQTVTSDFKIRVLLEGAGDGPKVYSILFK